MSSRVQTALLALLAVVAAALTVLALRAPEPPVDTLGSARSSSARGFQATPSPSAKAVQPVVATAGRARPLVVVVGDSYAAGTGATAPRSTAYPALIAADLTWDVRAAASPGAGYVVKGLGGPVIELLRRTPLARLDPDLVVLQAGHHDVTGDAEIAQIRGRVVEAVEAVRAAAPRAQVVVVGLLWPAAPPAGAAGADQALRDAAASAGVLFTHTFDLRFPGVAGNRTDDSGHQRIAVRLESSFRDLGLVTQ